MWQLVEATSGQPYHFSFSSGRTAIHGRRSSGADFCTVVLAAEAIRQGEKVVCIADKGEAIRQLQSELNVQQPEIKQRTVTNAVATELEEMQLVTIMKKSPVSLAASLRGLRDLDKRIIVIFDAEKVITADAWSLLAMHQPLVLSGDWTKLRFAPQSEMFATRILFSPPPQHWPDVRPLVPNYIGVLCSNQQPLQLMVHQYEA